MSAMRCALRWAMAVVLASLAATVGERASAAPAPTSTSTAAARRDEAKAAFGRGNTAYNLGKYADAIAEFEKAYSLSRLPEILFNLGQCYRKQWEADRRSELGRRALHYYEALLREAPATSSLRPDAEQFIAELAPAVAAAEAQERAGKIAAAKGAEALKLAQSFHAAGQLGDAAGVLDRLLREPGNGRDLLAEGYLLRGRVAAGQGDVLAAEVQFRRALELAPQAELAQPRGQEAAAFEAARKTVGPGGLRLVQAPLGEAQAGVAAKIDIKVEGDSEKLVAALELGYRNADTGAFLTARAKPPTTLSVPGVSMTPGARIDYYVRALDEHGGVVAESGTPTLPFRLQVAVPEELTERQAARRPKQWYEKWWVWTIAGAVVIGAGGAAYVVTRPESELVIQGATN